MSNARATRPASKHRYQRSHATQVRPLSSGCACSCLNVAITGRNPHPSCRSSSCRAVTVKEIVLSTASGKSQQLDALMRQPPQTLRDDDEARQRDDHIGKCGETNAWADTSGGARARETRNGWGTMRETQAGVRRL